MTIGIAASGPNAGEAIVTALAAVEAIGTGAIGGFVSLAVITGGGLFRAETQTGGSKALFAGQIPLEIAGASIAVLMSSGPNRPAPLSQFTPGDATVGLVTGHRFPNSPGDNGVPLNEEVLSMMRQGFGPEQAIGSVLGRNPMADAGLIAMSLDGNLYAADGRIVETFGDRGSAILRSETGATVAVLHNAILPYRGLAFVAAEIALDLMDAQHRALIDIRLEAGLPVVPGAENAIELDANNRATCISVSDSRLVNGRWSFGLGYRVKVRCRNQLRGRLAYEPYLVTQDGQLISIDGVKHATLSATLETNAHAFSN